jgi:mevalonate kinase
LYALGVFLRYTGIPLNQGLRLVISGDLPMGYGLGSSAAVTVGILRVASLFFQRSLSLSELLSLAKQVENLQHGLSSGIDPSVCLYEGVLLYTTNSITPRTLEPWPAYLINTGQPSSSTGECVESVKEKAFPVSLWSEFTRVTLACDQALQAHDTPLLQQAISENHRLLCQIGVVPSRIQEFIAEVEAAGGAAKICGAGSVRGDNAGFLLMLPGDLEKIEHLTHQFGFTVERVQLGVTINSSLE